MEQSLSDQILFSKYAVRDFDDKLVETSWAQVIDRIIDRLQEDLKFDSNEAVEFKEILFEKQFILGGRILHCVGNPFLPNLAISNCFVQPPPEDSIESIFDRAKQMARIYSWGGGVGMDISTLRPKGAPVRNSARFSSGSVSFVDFYSYVTNLIGQEGRRGANIQIENCYHPDIFDFVSLKDDLSVAQYSNLSVKVYDDFMRGVQDDLDYELVFDGKIYRTVRARDLMNAIIDHSWKTGEPGVLFWDTIVNYNPGSFCEELTPVGVNPCGETNLAAWESCILGSINLSKFIDWPFERGALLSIDKFTKVTRLAVRLLDYVLEFGIRNNKFPLEQTKKIAAAGRRIGLGIMGYADMLIKSRVEYGSEKALAITDAVAKLWSETAYSASCELAEEKGAFELYSDRYWRGHPLVESGAISADFVNKPIRNVSVLSIAPTGSISMLADCSSGIEPNFEFFYNRKVTINGEKKSIDVQSGIVKEFEKHIEEPILKNRYKLPNYFVSAMDLSQENKIYQRVDTQAIWQKYVDASISSTINLHENFPKEQMSDLYLYAWKKGLKGLTVYRAGTREGILTTPQPTEEVIPKKEKVNIGPVRKERDYKLHGVTYRLQTPLAPHSLYVTLNYNISEDGTKQPFEMFINSKWVDHFDYMVALTRLISSIFRQSSNPTFILKQLRSVMSPNSGYFRNGRFITSILVDIADVIEKFLVEEIGLKLEFPQTTKGGGEDEVGAEVKLQNFGEELITFRTCPVCKELSFVKEGGCWVCKNCGYDRCG